MNFELSKIICRLLMLNFFATKSGTKGWQIAKIALLRKLIPKNQMVTLKMLN